MKSLLAAWIRFQSEKPFLFWAVLVALIAGAAHLVSQSEIQAFPELTNVQVQVITLYPGKAAEEVERRLTVPLEVATTGVPGLIGQRSVSLFGLSVITLTFDDAVELRQARQVVAQRLGDADLPDGVKPSLSPESTPVGEIFRYTLKGNLPVDELRLIEDWTMERELKSIPGVADVVSFGGPTRSIDVVVDVPRMNAFGLNVGAIAQVLGQNHANAGGSLITRGEESYVVRSLGQYQRPEDLESAVIGTQHNTPIRVRDIGRVRIGHKMRLGQIGRNDEDDVVEGIVLLRQGSNTLQTCQAIRDRIAALNQRLPEGAHIEPYYDRTDLIRRCSYTVFHNVGVGILLVCAILGLGLGRRAWPLVVAVCAIIPFALLTALVGVRLFGYSPNLISLGAVDFGIIIETAIFAADSILAAIALAKRNDETVRGQALGAVLAPALLCALLLVIAFVPILSLERVEGRIFRPLGITLVWALIGGQLGAMIFVPWCARFLHADERPPSRRRWSLTGFLARIEAWGKWLASWPRLARVVAPAFALAVGALSWNIGREFLPQLNEGSLYIRATAPPTISREAAVELASRIRAKLRTIPEVVDIVDQIGRPDDGTDINGFDNIETMVTLTDPEAWRSARSIEGLTQLAQQRLQDIKGVDFNFSQPIKDNVDEAISGVKGELVVKIFGPDLRKLQDYADGVVGLLGATKGAEDVAAERVFGQPEMRFTMNRDLLARYGIRVTDAEDVLESAFVGKAAAQMLDPRGRLIDVVVKPELPENPSTRTLASLSVLSPDGGKITLGDVSQVELVEGVNRVYREGGEKRIAVKCSVRGRAVVDFVQEASRRIREKLTLPTGYRLEWSGSFENAARAGRQLVTIVPLCGVAILIVLYTWFGQWRYVGLLLWEVPFAAVGGLAALRLFGLNLSISAACGGIVLLGVSFLTGMMLINGWLHQRSPWAALRAEGRGILLSSAVAIVGLIPASLSHGMGAETARPFAVIILGGLVTSLFFTLGLMPALLAQASERE